LAGTSVGSEEYGIVGIGSGRMHIDVVNQTGLWRNIFNLEYKLEYSYKNSS